MEQPREQQSVMKVPIATDGGWGWMVLLGSFVAYFLADGWCYSFGVLFPSLLENFEEGKGKTSLIAALLYGLPLLLSPLVCALTTIYGCRVIGIVGGFVTAVSMLMSAFARSINFMCVSIGVIASIGLVMTYIPALIIVTFYFDKKRGLATGLAVTGSGLGAILFPPFMEYLCDVYSWRGFFIITSALCLHIMLAGFLYRPPKMGFPEDDLEEENTTEHDKCSDKFTNQRFRNAILVPRMHKQQSKSVNSCMDLHRAGMATHYRFVGTSELSLHMAGNFNGAVAIEMDCFYDHPKSVSSPELYNEGHKNETATMQLPENTTQEAKERQSNLTRLGVELRVIMLTMLDKSLFTNWAFLLFCAANFILYLWVGVPYIFLIDRAMELKISQNVHLYFLSSIIGIGRTIGQLVMGFLGDHPKINCNLLYGVSIVVIGLDTLLVPVCRDYVSLCIYSFVYGSFVSVTYAIQMMCLVEIVGIERATSGFGVLQLLQGVATILGTPLAGWLYDVTQAYDPTFYTSGAWMAFSGVMMLPIPWLIQKN